MPASKAELVLDALKALLETVPDAVVERNSALPEKIPDGGMIILRDGDPGEARAGARRLRDAYYQHAVEIEVYLEEGDAAARDAGLRRPPPADSVLRWRRTPPSAVSPSA